MRSHMPPFCPAVKSNIIPFPYLPVLLGGKGTSHVGWDTGDLPPQREIERAKKCAHALLWEMLLSLLSLFQRAASGGGQKNKVLFKVRACVSSTRVRPARPEGVSLYAPPKHIHIETPPPTPPTPPCSQQGMPRNLGWPACESAFQSP